MLIMLPKITKKSKIEALTRGQGWVMILGTMTNPRKTIPREDKP